MEMNLETRMGREIVWGSFITVLGEDNYIVSDIQPPDQYLLVFPGARL